MTLPLLANTEDGFESGSVSTTIWNGTNVDTQSKRFLRHYSYVAKLPYPDSIPYRGAYCLHVDLSLGTAAAYLESTRWATSLGVQLHGRFYLWVGSNLTTAASDRFSVFVAQSAGPVDEISIDLRNNAGVLQLVGVVQAGGSETLRTTTLVTNQWHCVEFSALINNGTNGTCLFRCDGFQLGTTVTGITNAAITQARLGAGCGAAASAAIDAGTTAGHLLFDDIAANTTRVGSLAERFGQTRVLTTSGHAVIGPAAILEADIVLSSTNDETLTLWDTDTADTSDISKRVFVYNAIRPIYVTRGLYCAITGTNPVAGIKIGTSQDCSEAGIKNLGLARQGV